MRPNTTATVLITAVALVLSAIPAFGQDAEPEVSPDPASAAFERPSVGVPLAGDQRDDGIIVLADTDFCSYLFGEVWGNEKLTFRGLIDRTKKQKKAKKAAFQPYADEAALQRCASVLDAFRQEAPEGDSLPAWAREAPVVPAAVAVLLPPDLSERPLAEPADIGDGARTSGFGDSTSAPFSLWGGAYFVDVNAPACESWTGTIRSAPDPTAEAAVVEDTRYLYGIPLGNYFWDIAAPDCDWSVDLVVYELPPDPTPTPTPKVEVPALVGQTWNRGGENPAFLTPAAAAEALIEAGLTVNICQVVRDVFVTQGRVAAQDPPPGSLVDPGSSIRVHVTFPSTCAELPLSEDAQTF